jgi:hypothetical protein
MARTDDPMLTTALKQVRGAAQGVTELALRACPNIFNSEAGTPTSSEH